MEQSKQKPQLVKVQQNNDDMALVGFMALISVALIFILWVS